MVSQRRLLTRRWVPAARYLCATIAAFALLATSTRPNEAAQDDPQELRERIERFLRTPHIHGIGYEEAKSLGPQALPILERISLDSAYKSVWWKAVLAVGYIGGQNSFATLKRFMWNRFTGEIDFDTFVAQTTALVAMGWIDGPGEAERLRYLSKGTNPAFWTGLPWRCPAVGEPGIANVLLSKSAINGLSLTGSAYADSVFEQLAKKPHSPRQVGNIEDGQERNRQIRMVGRQMYLQQNRKRDSR